MKCHQCGREIQTDAKFCAYCGAKMEQNIIDTTLVRESKAQKACPGCGKVFAPEHVYCDQCGRLLQVKTVSGRELQRIHMASKYDGEPTVGIAKATGDLILYDDRIEFKRVMGNALGNAFGLLGMAAAARSTPQQEVYRMSEIASVKLGRYGGMMPTLVLQLKNGSIYSFCGIADSNTIQKAINLIEEYRPLN